VGHAWTNVWSTTFAINGGPNCDRAGKLGSDASSLYWLAGLGKSRLVHEVESMQKTAHRCSRANGGKEKNLKKRREWNEERKGGEDGKRGGGELDKGA